MLRSCITVKSSVIVTETIGYPIKKKTVRNVKLSDNYCVRASKVIGGQTKKVQMSKTYL